MDFKDNLDKPLFKQVKIGDLELKNRIVMAALSRCRAESADGIPNDLHVEYYSARADAGLIITECAQVSFDDISFSGGVGSYSKAQTEGWKRVVDAVHERGAKIFMQIWHSGRPTHLECTDAIPPTTFTVPQSDLCYTDNVKAPHIAPKEATEEDLLQFIQDFRKGAENAKAAGFDGVELDGAHGFLIDQFLKESSNKRTDKWGGSIENRCRLGLKVIDQLIEVFGENRVGIKISPLVRFEEMEESDLTGLYTYFIEELNKRNIAFLEVNEGYTITDTEEAAPSNELLKNQLFDGNVGKFFKKLFKGVYIANHGYTFETANKAIEEGRADLVSFGSLFIANSDLVKKFKTGEKINELSNVDDKSKIESYLYRSGPKGYTDTSVFKAKDSGMQEKEGIES